LPSFLTTQPVEHMAADVAPQRARRRGNRRRGNNIQLGVGDEEVGDENIEQWGFENPSPSFSTPPFRSSPVYEQSPHGETGSSSNMAGFRNYEEGGTSSNQYQMMNFADSFFPASEHLFSSRTPSYASFGGQPRSYTPTPMGPNYFSQDDTAHNVFGVASSEERPHFSEMTPLPPPDFYDDLTGGPRRSMRDPQPTRCYTRGLLLSHQDHDHEDGRGQRREGGRGRGGGFQPWGQ